MKDALPPPGLAFKYPTTLPLSMLSAFTSALVGFAKVLDSAGTLKIKKLGTFLIAVDIEFAVSRYCSRSKNTHVIKRI